MAGQPRSLHRHLEEGRWVDSAAGLCRDLGYDLLVGVDHDAVNGCRITDHLIAALEESAGESPGSALFGWI